MKPRYIFLVTMVIFLSGYTIVTGQRTYSQHSILARGSWHKLAVTAPGIYKIDIPLLNSMGITGNLPSAALRLFGSGGAMLPESCGQPRYDDLPEVALHIEDGNDGFINGNDYILFYAPGTHRWLYNAVQGGFMHQHNLYSDTAWYFISTGDDGLRIQQDNNPAAGAVTVRDFDYRVFYERDSINFLQSGKQWWGQEFGKVSGNSRTYDFQLPAAPAGPVTVSIRAAARGAAGSNFRVSLNNTAATEIYLLPVGGSVFESIATAAAGSGQAVVNQAAVQAGVTFLPGDLNAKGWLDYLEITARCPLQLPASGALSFRRPVTVGQGESVRYVLHHATAETQVWDVTDPLRPVAVRGLLAGDSLAFSRSGDRLREFIAFGSSDMRKPLPAGAVPNQDLHGAAKGEMIIVTAPAFISQAQRIAAWHRARGMADVVVATTSEIYNEFASGSPDPAAIRDYVKMFYDRGVAPRYLLLFGAASYDYRQRINNNTSLVPAWQSEASLDAIRSHMSDDFFGFLDDAEDISRTDITNLLDISIGRLPARNITEATLAADKIIRYHQPGGFGEWRNRVTLLADDEDDNLHFDDAEIMSSTLIKSNHLPNISKIYIDAYPQEATPQGSRSPEVNRALATTINKGTLVLNYNGHGSSSRLAEETVMDEKSIDSWQHENKLPLLITATCDFAPFDNPAVQSLGHQLLMQRSSGAIALMTTTRAVFANANRVMNSNYLQALFTPLPDGTMPPLGTAAMQAKNLTYLTSGDVINNRKFQLLGDPALTLAFPHYRVVTDSINGRAVTTGTDTLRALQHCTIKGHIADPLGNPVQDFNGALTTTVFDKPATRRTRGNDPRSRAADYQLQQQVLFKGTQTVQDGQFIINFTVPADLQQGNGMAKVSYYAAGAQEDAGGYYDRLTTGDKAGAVPEDKKGPDIKLWLDSRAFVNGDITGPSPVLLVELADSSGISISGNNPAHNLVAILDSLEYFTLNDYFEASLNEYRKGEIRFPLTGLPAGEHRITVKAWDTHNNGATSTLSFKVAEPGTLAIEEVTNYPNPVSHSTRFTFLHNQQGQELQIALQIFTTDGRLVKTMHNTIISGNSRFDGIPWDGRSESGARLPAGIYIYRLIIGSSGKTRAMGGKMVLL
ncbi:type IX secretion system sortase PorU [Chitinophaga solisilvae]|uniref:type IX secretion system sortase PorU n=1 Tax=Chitinophaga solisilvae TaxID=1233460 RepID=UPI00136D161F|nr:type IX secretion system sortase PorU [Chitinophaga solisilvae]